MAAMSPRAASFCLWLQITTKKGYPPVPTASATFILTSNLGRSAVHALWGRGDLEELELCGIQPDHCVEMDKAREKLEEARDFGYMYESQKDSVLQFQKSFCVEVCVVPPRSTILMPDRAGANSYPRARFDQPRGV